VVIDILLDKISMNKARAFNPFLCAKTDKLMALIAEVQVQMSGYEFFYQTRKRARRPADQATYNRTVEAILYGIAGKSPPEGDLYDLSAEGIPTDYRKGIKTVIQALINSSKVPTKMPKGVRKLIPSRYNIKDILEAVARKHPAIYPQMTSGIGMQLFRKESDILVDVLLTLKTQGIVALPIHDAVVVRDDNSDKAKAVMKKVFKEHTGITPDVTLG
jgi:hypothetical protein